MVPRYEVPHDGAHESTEDHVRVHVLGRQDALAYGRGDIELEDREGDEVEEGGPYDGLVGAQDSGRDHRGDGVRRVVKPVQEVKQ